MFPLTNGSRGIGPAIAVYAGGLVVGYVAGFLATYFFGLSKAELERLNAADDTTVVGDPGMSEEASAEPGRRAGVENAAR